MSTRIRYAKDESGVLVSTKKFVSGNEALTVRISPANNETRGVGPNQFRALVLNGDGLQLFEEVSDFVTVKKKVKVWLKGYGVNFDDEVRKRG